jgi:pimeloyl-ACP methyl ester carboxylesterase
MPTPEGAPWQDIHYAAQDGLRLHARHYPSHSAARHRPLVCLPGLTRNGRDFHRLAVALSSDPRRPRDVYTVDYRGRGLSAFDPDWRNYTPLVELSDTLDLMALCGLRKPAVLGTSRGGLIAMSMAALRPAAMGAVILNDIGPVVETRGLARIMTYVGKLPLPQSWPDAIAQQREVHGKTFPAIDDAGWAAYAHAVFNEEDGKPAPGYDPALAHTLSGLDLSGPMPALWQQFTALYPFPALLLRGANSDLLTEETASAMVDRHPNLHRVTVPGQGHSPMLMDADTIEAIARFLAAND